MKADPQAATESVAPDFSIVLGGPLYQMFRKARLSGDVLELLSRRVMVLVTIAWLPALVLAILEGHAWGREGQLPFLFDVDMHARFLLALPLLILAELVVHQRMRPVVEAFLKRGLVPESARVKFDAAIASATRLRNSVLAEVLLVALVYGVGVLLVWRHHSALELNAWYGKTVDGTLQPTWAGWWLGCVSLPIFQFILVRWYFRLIIWARFLWHVSRIDLQLLPTHPDRAGGLGFLAHLSYAFGPLLAAQGVMFAGVFANKILYAGARLPDFKLEVVALIVVMLFFVLAPLLVFVPLLARTKRIGLNEYGGLAQRYAMEFDQKWLRGGAPPDEPLIGSADIQSLADMSNSYEVIKGMKPVPFGKQTIFQLAVISLAPLSPLVLTMIPLGDLLDRFLHVLL